MICCGHLWSSRRPWPRTVRSTGTLTISVYGLLLWIIMSAVSAARPVRYIVPTFMNTPNNVTAVVGSDVLLPCVVENLGPKSVIWRKVSKQSPISIGNYVFDPDRHYTITRVDPYSDPRMSRFNNHQLNHENPTWNLLVSDVKMSHAGTYQCNVSTKKVMIRNITLNVVEDRSNRHKSKKTGITLTGSKFADKGAVIDLNCTATAVNYRPKSLDWFKDGTRLKQGGRRLITDQYMAESNVVHSRLEIQRVNMDDAGTYVCRFSQKHVESIKVIVLNTDSSNKRRGTGTEGMETDRSGSRSRNQAGYDRPGAGPAEHGSGRDSGHVTQLSPTLCLALVICAFAWTLPARLDVVKV